MGVKYFKDDENQGTKVAQYVKETVWDRKGIVATPIEYGENARKQFLGMDYEFENGKSVDIKAQVNRYLNEPTPTFSLELSYTKDDEFRCGWLLDSTKKTTRYGLSRVFASDYVGTRDNKKLLKPEDIHICDTIFVTVATLKKELVNRFGLEGKFLKEAAYTVYQMTKESGEEFRCDIVSVAKEKKLCPEMDMWELLKKHSFTDKDQGATWGKEIWLMKTRALRLGGYGKDEEPINLIVRYSFYREIARSEYISLNDFTIETNPKTFLRKNKKGYNDDVLENLLRANTSRDALREAIMSSDDFETKRIPKTKVFKLFYKGA